LHRLASEHDRYGPKSLQATFLHGYEHSLAHKVRVRPYRSPERRFELESKLQVLSERRHDRLRDPGALMLSSIRDGECGHVESIHAIPVRKLACAALEGDTLRLGWLRAHAAS